MTSESLSQWHTYSSKTSGPAYLTLLSKFLAEKANTLGENQSDHTAHPGARQTPSLKTSQGLISVLLENQLNKLKDFQNSTKQDNMIRSNFDLKNSKAII